MSEPPDEVGQLLGSTPGRIPDSQRRARTLSATTRTLRRRQAFGRVVKAASVVAVFATGGVVGWVVKPPSTVAVVVGLSQPIAPTPSDPIGPEPLTAERLELNAELADDPAEAARLYREAGDRFLNDRDYENAARCYRRHLAVADADGRKVSASDSWMLLTMKVPVR